MKTDQEVIGIVGLGYVGLPLALAFSEKFDVVGFDIKKDRIAELQSGADHTGEGDTAQLKNPRLSFTSNAADLQRCTFLVVAVPTPVTVMVSDGSEGAPPTSGPVKSLARTLIVVVAVARTTMPASVLAIGLSLTSVTVIETVATLESRLPSLALKVKLSGPL